MKLNLVASPGTSCSPHFSNSCHSGKSTSTTGQSGNPGWHRHSFHCALCEQYTQFDLINYMPTLPETPSGEAKMLFLDIPFNLFDFDFPEPEPCNSKHLSYTTRPCSWDVTRHHDNTPTSRSGHTFELLKKSSQLFFSFSLCSSISFAWTGHRR